MDSGVGRIGGRCVRGGWQRSTWLAPRRRTARFVSGPARFWRAPACLRRRLGVPQMQTGGSLRCTSGSRIIGAGPARFLIREPNPTLAAHTPDGGPTRAVGVYWLRFRPLSSNPVQLIPNPTLRIRTQPHSTSRSPTHYWLALSCQHTIGSHFCSCTVVLVRISRNWESCNKTGQKYRAHKHAKLVASHDFRTSLAATSSALAAANAALAAKSARCASSSSPTLRTCPFSTVARPATTMRTVANPESGFKYLEKVAQK